MTSPPNDFTNPAGTDGHHGRPKADGIPEQRLPEPVDGHAEQPTDSADGHATAVAHAADGPAAADGQAGGGAGPKPGVAPRAGTSLLGSAPADAETGLIAVSSQGSLGGSSSDAAAPNQTLYLGNLHPFVSEATLQEVFAGLLGITELKVIKDKATGVSAGYGFAKFTDPGHAAVALERVHKVLLFGQEMRVNWAFQKEQQEEVAAHVHVFVGDLSPDVSDAVLLAAFQACPGCSDARVMWDHATGRSRGYGFVSFRTPAEAEAAIAGMHGQFVGSRRVRCGWAQHKTDPAAPVDPSLLDRADPTNTNVYVGNLAPQLTGECPLRQR